MTQQKLGLSQQKRSISENIFKGEKMKLGYDPTTGPLTVFDDYLRMSHYL